MWRFARGEALFGDSQALMEIFKGEVLYGDSQGGHLRGGIIWRFSREALCGDSQEERHYLEILKGVIIWRFLRGRHYMEILKGDT